MSKILTSEISKYLNGNSSRKTKEVNLIPLIPPSELLQGAPMNPSIGKDSNGNIYCTIRTVNYIFYHSRKILHPFGVLTYCHPENDMKLRTWNLLCDINNDLQPTNFRKIDTSLTEAHKSQWNFIGHEDVRLFEWNERWYVCGIRRDFKPNGESRMELCEFDVNSATELDRFRIPSTGDDGSYCEKNWMPITTMPHHFVKWSNPVEIVKADPENKTCTTVHLSDKVHPLGYDLRGSSQLIPYEGGFLAVCHITRLWKNEITNTKDSVYRHCFVKYSNEFEVEFITEEFSFLDGDIEFAAGMIEHNGNFVISFGYTDNAAFLLEVPKKIVENLNKVYEN